MSDQSRLAAAIDGNPKALQELVGELTPVVQARVARALLRHAAGRSRSTQQEVEDMTQEVFLSMFADDHKVLRSWDPELGLSLQNFVGLVAQRRVVSILRTHKREPWFEEPMADLGADDVHTAPVWMESAVQSRQLLERLVEQLEATLSQRGYALFLRLYVHEESVEAVADALGMTPNAVHQWRHRLGAAAKAALTSLKQEQSGDYAQAEVPAPRADAPKSLSGRLS